jgi:uncharacterized protein YegP (UPF0339 family)
LHKRFRAIFEEDHSADLHVEIRADIMLWRALRFVGYQQSADQHDPEDVIELRNCTCGSTLGRRTRRTLMKFEVYRDKAGEYRWRLLSSNGQISADSGEGYTRRDDAHRSISVLLKGLADVVIVDA